MPRFSTEVPPKTDSKPLPTTSLHSELSTDSSTKPDTDTVTKNVKSWDGVENDTEDNSYDYTGAWDDSPPELNLQDSLPSSLSPPSPSSPLLPGPFTADKSPLKATREDHVKSATKGQKGSGRGNSTTGMPSVLVESKSGMTVRPDGKEIPIAIPSPRFTVFKRDAPNAAQESRRFYAYWNSLPTWAKDRTLCYVYRDWPVLRQLPEDSKDFVYIDKISGSEPLQTDEDLINMYGSGSYKLMFNETSPSGRNICQVFVPNLGIHDLKSHPPVDRRISDVANVDLDFPGNKSYIEYLRMTGKLPEQQKGKELEAEMAVTSLIDKVSDQNAELVDKLVTMASEKGRRNEEPSADAVKNAIEIVADGARRSNQMLMDTINVVKEKDKEGSTEPVKLALELLTVMRGGGSNDEEVRELRAELAKAQDKQFTLLMEMVKEAREQASKTAAATTSNPAQSPFAYMKDGFSAIKEARQILEDMNPKASPVEEAAEAAGLPAWVMPAIQYGAPLLSNILTLAMARMGLIQPGSISMPQGTPQPIPNPNQPIQPYPYTPPMPPSNVVTMPGNSDSVQSIPASGQIPNATSAAPLPSGIQSYGLPQDVAELLYECKTGMCAYISNGASGTDYAGLFVDNYGEGTFKQVMGFGTEGLLGAIMQFPPIMTRLNALGVSADRLKQFVREFVTFNPIDEADTVHNEPEAS